MKEKWQLDIEENIKYGLIELLILLLLKTEDMYGYQIVQEISKKSNDIINIKEGSLYGPLYRLENKKYVSVKKELVGKRRFRNYYHLEKPGLEYLEYALQTHKKINAGLELIKNLESVKNE